MVLCFLDIFLVKDTYFLSKNYLFRIIFFRGFEVFKVLKVIVGVEAIEIFRNFAFVMKRSRVIYGTIMLAVYLCWMLSATCFVHTHDYSWGKVTHSHPYSDSRHTHTQSACQLIDYLDWAVAEKAADTVAVAVGFVVLGKVDRPDIRVVDASVCARSLRAPPVFPIS